MADNENTINTLTEELGKPDFSYLIPSDRRDDLTRLMNKMVAKGKKANLPLMTYYIEEAPPLTDPNNEDFVMPRMRVSVWNPLVDVGDYRLLAKLDHSEGGTPLIVRTASFNDIPEQFLSAGCKPDCDHCKSNRDRKFTFLLQHRQNGDVKQIGTSCVSEFTRNDSASALLEYFAVTGETLNMILFAIERETEDGFGSGKLVYDGIKPEKIVAATLAVMARCGNEYLSKSRAMELGALSTTDLVANYFYGKTRLISRLDMTGYLNQARDILEWEKQDLIDPRFRNTELGHNQKVLSRSESVPSQKMGFVCSLVPMYMKYMEDQKKKAFDKASSHQFNVGDKVATRLTGYKKFSYDNQWGSVYGQLYHDQSGNVYKYQTASPNRLAALHVEYDVKATIKDHGEYNDIKQTVLTRVSYPALAAFEKLEKETDPKKLNKILKEIPHDLLVRDRNGHTVPWFKQIFESGYGFASLEALAAICKHPNHHPHLESYFSQAPDFLDCLAYRNGDFALKKGIFDLARPRGAHFDIERMEGGVNNANLEDTLSFLHDIKDKQNYLKFLAIAYNDVPQITDSLVGGLNELKQKQPWGVNPVFRVDADNKYIVIAELHGNNLTTVYEDSTGTVRFGDYPLDNTFPAHQSQWIDHVLQLHNNFTGDQLVESGIDRIHSGSSASPA